MREDASEKNTVFQVSAGPEKRIRHPSLSWTIISFYKQNPAREPFIGTEEIYLRHLGGVPGSRYISAFLWVKYPCPIATFEVRKFSRCGQGRKSCGTR